MQSSILLVIFLLLSLVLASPADAHTFGASYRFPIPVTWYLVASGLVLILSFVMLSVRTKRIKKSVFPEITLVKQIPSPILPIFQIGSLFFFFIVILAGLIGVSTSAFNISITFFWVLFVIGMTYLTAVVGDIWEILNPWKTLISLYERLSKYEVNGQYVLPKSFGYYPALFFYFLFIFIELLLGTSPFSLAIFLIQYTLIVLGGCFLFGKRVWFERGEFFSVFFRFISYGSMMLLSRRRITLRVPIVGLLQAKATHSSVVIFILFMLSSTAFDGFRETNLWYTWYWNTFRGLSQSMLWDSYGFRIYEILGLTLSPLLFYGFYLLCMVSMKIVIHTERTIGALSLRFAFTLIPIAFAYHMAHYLTLLILQGQYSFRLLSDPFGYDWNLFGTAGWDALIITIPASIVWHFQLGVIIVGHILSVFLGHAVALQTFPDTKKALISQIPLLLLMVLFTVIGLWILSQPLGANL